MAWRSQRMPAALIWEIWQRLAPPPSERVPGDLCDDYLEKGGGSYSSETTALDASAERGPSILHIASANRAHTAWRSQRMPAVLSWDIWFGAAVRRSRRGIAAGCVAREWWDRHVMNS